MPFLQTRSLTLWRGPRARPRTPGRQEMQRRSTRRSHTKRKSTRRLKRRSIKSPKRRARTETRRGTDTPRGTLNSRNNHRPTTSQSPGMLLPEATQPNCHTIVQQHTRMLDDPRSTLTLLLPLTAGTTNSMSGITPTMMSLMSPTCLRNSPWTPPTQRMCTMSWTTLQRKMTAISRSPSRRPIRGGGCSGGQQTRMKTYSLAEKAAGEVGSNGEGAK